MWSEGASQLPKCGQLVIYMVSSHDKIMSVPTGEGKRTWELSDLEGIAKFLLL